MKMVGGTISLILRQQPYSTWGLGVYADVAKEGEEVKITSN